MQYKQIGIRTGYHCPASLPVQSALTAMQSCAAMQHDSKEQSQHALPRLQQRLLPKLVPHEP